MPDGWTTQPPCGAGEPLAEDERATAIVFERFLAVPASPAAAARELLRALPDVFDECVLLEQGPVRVADGREGFGLAVRYRDDDGDLRFRRHLVATAGPYVCELVVEHPEGSASCPEETVKAIAGSLRLVGVDFCASARALDRDWFRAPAEGGEDAPREFPFLGRSLPTPQGWTAAEGGDGASFRAPGVELGVRRVMASDGDAGEWLAGRMGEAAARSETVLASRQWEGEDGAELAGVLTDDRARLTWQSNVRRQVLEVFAGEPVPAVFRLAAEPQRLEEAAAALGSLLHGSVALPEERWRTRVAEPWVKLVLEGPWRNPALGAYVRVGEPVATLALLAQPSPSPLGVLADALVRGLRPSLEKVDDERSSRGPLRGVEALSVRVTGRGNLGSGTVVRGLWLVSEGTLYTTVLQGSSAELVDTLGSELGRGLDLPGMER